MPPNASPALRLYGLAMGAAAPWAPALLRARARRGKEEIDRLGERLGHASRERPAGRLVWLHGASVGEGLSLLPLADAVLADRRGFNVLVTTGTRTSAQLLARRLPAGAIHQYGPIDTPAAVGAFLDHWRPEAGVFVESELWPNLIIAAKARGVRLVLISARLSARSLQGWRLAPRAARTVLGAFDQVLARDEAAAQGLRAIGGRVDGLADLKFGAPPLPVDQAALDLWRGRLAAAPVVLAASTHQGEESPIIAQFARLEGAPGALLAVAPRHPERTEEIERLGGEFSLSTGRASAPAEAGRVRILIVDTLGDLGLWYRLADIAFIGGSLVAGVGGHNPLEAARLDCPMIFGPHFESWPIYGELARQGAALPIFRSEDLGGAMRDLLAGDRRAAAMAAKARAFVDARDAEARAVAGRVMAGLDR
jgi:3-deoxy-D-manno-octulosonic-acid transferase